MRGIVSYGEYLPAIRVALRRGRERIACSFDEDTTTMAVEACRTALAAAPDLAAEELVFVTTHPAYLDKANATAIHAALSLPTAAIATDAGVSARSSVAALRSAARAAGTTIVVAGDVRVGLPGSADESGGADAAAALVFGSDGDGSPVLAEHLGSGSETAEFLDRWQLPNEPHARAWEERFGYETYLELLEPALERALAAAGVAAAEIDELVVTGTNTRAAGGAARKLARLCGNAAEPAKSLGDSGAASGLLGLCSVLDRAEPGARIAWVSLADGVDVEIFAAQEALAGFRDARPKPSRRTVATDYLDYLVWRGELGRERPRRPDQPRPAAPPSRRSEHWKFGLVGSTCEVCGRRYAPPQRRCVCGALDQMVETPLHRAEGTVATFTLDHLAFSPQPPIAFAAVDLDGGGRMQCQLTDVAPGEVKIGDRVEMTFRKLFTSEGVHNYFWKARPVAADSETGGER